MAENGPDGQADIRALRLALEALERRVQQLEAAGGPAPVAVRGAPEAEESVPESLLAGVARAPAAAGRLLLVMGGAYLLRAFTEIDQVPGTVGALLGLAYGLVWLALADRAGRGGDAYVATWRGAASALIVFPLLWETSSRFGFLSFPVAAALVAACALAAFGIAARRTVPGLGGIFSAASALGGLALLLPNPAAAVPATTALLVIGLAALVIGRRRALTGAMWTSAAAADAAALLLVEGTLRGSGAAPLTAIVLLSLLFAGFFACIAFDVLRGNRRLDGFDWAQTAVALVVGLGGAMLIARQTDTLETALGLTAVLLAVGLYMLAFTVLERERRRCFLYLTSIALVLVLGASASLLERPALPWALLAAATALTARRFGRTTLGVHAAVYALAAVITSGVLLHAYDGWTALRGDLPAGLDAWIATAALLLVAARRIRGTRAATVPTGAFVHAAMLVLFVAVGTGLALRAATVLLSPDAGAPAPDGWLTASRTVTLALATILCAWLARRPTCGILRRVVPVLLAAGALKLLFEDVAAGKPVSLALSFSAFGVALILAPRLIRRHSPPPA